MKILLTIVGILLLVIVGLFIITFLVYFFNLDMKLTALIEPMMIKHYNKIERDSHL